MHLLERRESSFIVLGWAAAQRVFNNAWNLSPVEEDCLFVCLFVFRGEDCCLLNCVSAILLQDAPQQA